MKTIKSLLALLIAGILLFTTVGCGGANNSNSEIKKGAPSLFDEKELFIGAYCAPNPTDEQYKFASEFGLTHMMVGGGDYFKTYPYDTEEYYQKPFDLAEKYGMEVILHIEDSSYKVLGNDILEEVRERSNFDGFLVCDEPPKQRYKFYMDDYQDFKNDFQDKSYFINLLPIYATEEQLGNCYYNEYLTLYQNMILKNYVEGKRYVMCDCYPLLNNGFTYSKWLYNLELLNNMVTRVDGELYLYIQAQGFLGRWRQPANLAEIKYQIYVAMAYGVKGIAYYPYQMPSSSEPEELSPIDLDGNKTYMYGLCQKANEEIKKFDGVYLDFDWKGVIGRIGKNNIDKENENFAVCKNLIKSFGVLNSAESKYDSIIGCFENKDGYQGFLAVNFNDPYTNLNNEVTFNFKGADKAIVYRKGVPTTVDVVDEHLTEKLGLGEAVFVVPYRG